MGVSLERVQFKFASIIGELCSDPDVLSQFAVWLDLRLAEYKLKGAISLDCSGEEPDPVWLKGLSKGKKTSAAERERMMAGSGPTPGRGPLSQRSTPQSPAKDIPKSHSQGMPSPDLLNRLSPDDVVVVKDEPSDVYPVELHIHETVDSSFAGRRKRSAAETVSHEHWSHDVSSGSPKHRRISATTESLANQSLMSVIGGYKDKQESDLTGDHSGDLSGVPGADLHSSAALASRGTVNPQADLSADFIDTTLNNSQSSQDITWMNQSGMIGDQSGLGVNISESVHNLNRKQHDNRHRLEKIDARRLAHIPARTANNMVASVRTFERWLWGRYDNERRAITEIPPVQLDYYLREFFEIVVTPNGTPYKPESFGALRSFLCRYLKETNYPEDLKTSHAFRASNNAFRERRKRLCGAVNEIETNEFTDQGKDIVGI